MAKCINTPKSRRKQDAASTDKDEPMRKDTRWIWTLALSGVLAAPAGWANETAAASRETSREQAREANEAAAREAADAVRSATRLDLDIRLIGPTSLTVADRR